METHPVEAGDPPLRLKGRTVIVRAEHSIYILARGELNGKGSHYDHRELQPFGLMDGHHLNVSLGKGLASEKVSWLFCWR